MFVPGYAVAAGFTDETPSLISVLATAGGQMFFSLSLAMGAMITYGSYLSKKENIVKNSALIVIADSIVALMAGLAVIPAAVANGIANGTPLSDIALGGPEAAVRHAPGRVRQHGRGRSAVRHRVLSARHHRRHLVRHLADGGRRRALHR